MDAIDRLDRLANTLDRPSPPDAMLVIDVIEEEGNLHGEYYYAVHSEKTVFWLHSFDTYEIDTCHEVYGPETLPHLGESISVVHAGTSSLYTQVSSCERNTGTYYTEGLFLPL